MHTGIVPREIATGHELALARLKDALDFYDRVNASDEAEQLAVGTDHIDGVLAAARRAAECAPIIRG